MKALSLIALLGAVIGWVATDLFLPSSDRVSEPEPSGPRSLVLAQVSGAAPPLPDDASLNSFDGTADRLGQLASASDANLKRWILELKRDRPHRP